MITVADLVSAGLKAPQDRIEQAIQVLEGKPPVQAPPVEPLLTATQVAAQLNVSRMSIHRWKIPPAFRLAGKPRWQMSSILRYLASDEFKAQAEHLRRTRVFKRKAV